jgi:hypothetical protein
VRVCTCPHLSVVKPNDLVLETGNPAVGKHG